MVTMQIYLLLTILALISTVDSSLESKRRHHVNPSHHQSDILYKRAVSGRATFYEINPGDLGACGDSLNPNEFIVALNQDMYGGLDSRSHYCGKTIEISHGGKTAQAVIKDVCPSANGGCPYGALDMSEALFKHFASENAGVFDMSWHFIGEDDNGKAATDAAAKKKAQEDAANAKKKQEEDAIKKKKAEEEAAARKKKADDEAAKQKQKADKEEAQRKAAEEKKKAEDAKKAADDKQKADAKRAADDRKAADDKKAADDAAAKAKQKQIDDRKAKDAAVAEEKKRKSQSSSSSPPPPAAAAEKESKKVGLEQLPDHQTANINSFNELLQGLDQIVQDGHDHKML